MMVFFYNFIKTYSTNITRAVGPTALTLARPAIIGGPHVYLAPFPEGNDANDGSTSALAVATVAKAHAQMGVLGRSSILIVRKNYVGTINFTLNVVLVFNNQVLQTELGTIATITAAGIGVLRLLAGARFVNIILDVPVKFLNSTGGDIENCETNNNIELDNTGVAFVLNLKYSIITNRNVAETDRPFDWDQLDIPACVLNIDNCVFYASDNVRSGILIEGQSSVAQFSLLINRTYFVDCERAIESEFTKAEIIGSNPIYSLKSCSTMNCDFVFEFQGGVDATADYCLFPNTLLGPAAQIAVDTPGDSTFSNTNVISSDTNPYFVSEIDGLAGDVNGFRLQFLGKSTPNGISRYFINSPLIGAGFAAVDVNPWDESTSLVSQGYNKSVEVRWSNASYKEIDKKGKPVFLEDANGNIHQDYEKQRRHLTFTFGSDQQISLSQRRQIKDMLADKGSKQFYPNGLDVNVYDLAKPVSQGIFSDTDNSIAPEDTAGNELIGDDWRGFWITIGANEYYIISNDESKLYIVDKLGSGFPTNGNKQFRVSYYLVNNSPVDFVEVQTGFTEFEQGGRIRTDYKSSVSYDLTIESFDVQEVEDNLEG